MSCDNDKFINLIITTFVVFVIYLIWRLRFVYYLFYSPTCPSCISLKPEWKEFKKHAGLFTMISEINLEENPNHYLAKKYNVQTVPTIIKSGWFDYKVYNGERTAKEMKKILH
jgi:thiol-disulfide isomerase/thioredoxin